MSEQPCLFSNNITVLNDDRKLQCRYAECHYADCRFTECHYAECRSATDQSIG